MLSRQTMLAAVCGKVSRACAQDREPGYQLSRRGYRAVSQIVAVTPFERPGRRQARTRSPQKTQPPAYPPCGFGHGLDNILR